MSGFNIKFDAGFGGNTNTLKQGLTNLNFSTIAQTKPKTNPLTSLPRISDTKQIMSKPSRNIIPRITIPEKAKNKQKEQPPSINIIPRITIPEKDVTSDTTPSIQEVIGKMDIMGSISQSIGQQFQQRPLDIPIESMKGVVKVDFSDMSAAGESLRKMNPNNKFFTDPARSSSYYDSIRNPPSTRTQIPADNTMMSGDNTMNTMMSGDNTMMYVAGGFGIVGLIGAFDLLSD